MNPEQQRDRRRAQLDAVNDAVPALNDARLWLHLTLAGAVAVNDDLRGALPAAVLEQLDAADSAYAVWNERLKDLVKAYEVDAADPAPDASAATP